MALLEALPGLAVDAVEPDAEVAAAAHRFFGVPLGGGVRLTLHALDGASFLGDARHAGQVRRCLYLCDGRAGRVWCTEGESSDVRASPVLHEKHTEHHVTCLGSSYTAEGGNNYLSMVH